MNSTRLQLETPLGVLIFSAYSESGDADLSLTLGKATAYLPSGMAVEQRDACVLKCKASNKITGLIYECYWESPFSKGSPETGECLDAQSWSNGKSLVLIGTEDFDVLVRRLPNCGLSEANWPPFPDHGLKIRIPEIESGREVSLHFVVASNSLPEPKECSCWFAVDIDHESVLEYLV